VFSFGGSDQESPSRKQPSPGSTFTSDYLRKRNDELEVTGKVLASKNHAIAKKLSAVETTLVEAKRIIKDLRRELSHQAHKAATRIQTKENSKQQDLPLTKQSMAVQTTPGVLVKATPPRGPNSTPRPKFNGRSSSNKVLDVSSPPEKLETPRTAPISTPSASSQETTSSKSSKNGGRPMPVSLHVSTSVPSNESMSGGKAEQTIPSNYDEDEDELELSLLSTSAMSPLVPKWLSPGSLFMEMTTPSPPPRVPAPEFGNAALFSHHSSLSNAPPPSPVAGAGNFPSSPPSIFADAHTAKVSLPSTAVAPSAQTPLRPALASLSGCPPLPGQLQAASADSPAKTLVSPLPDPARSADKVLVVLVIYDHSLRARLGFLASRF
jgi:hypothetical protein